jgi:predicted TIM-barrel fold metal-dependent hydrolase
MGRRFYNCHAHSFTYDHVPEFFLLKGVRISRLLKTRFISWFIKGSYKVGGSFFIRSFAFIFGVDKTRVIRLVNFITYGNVSTQSEVIEKMRAYYPASTGVVLLSMDMEYMGAGKPVKDYEMQLNELEEMKKTAKYAHTIYPFVFCDPRRIRPENAREHAVETKFTGIEFLHKLETLIEDRSFQGIKLYPALGYFPFDARMKPVYDFALKNCVPIITHCTLGAVHLKYKPEADERIHPVLAAMGLQQTQLRGKTGAKFQKWYSHPLNYECLMNKDLLKHYWVGDAPDYSKLKICLAHWGDAQDWKNYLDNPWLETGERYRDCDWPSLDMRNWRLDKKLEHLNYSWFTIICDMMRKYPNVYADISYTLNDESLLPLLKMTLEADPVIRKKVLFGTDFYMVSKALCERRYSVAVRAALGNTLFEQIAIDNAERFLNNGFGNVGYPWTPQRERKIVEAGVCNDVAVMDNE